MFPVAVRDASRWFRWDLVVNFLGVAQAEQYLMTLDSCLSPHNTRQARGMTPHWAGQRNILRR